MADALITDEEISTSLINLLLKDSSLLLTEGYLLITNLPAKLNNSSPSAVLD